jgi:hypothetical protein
MSQARIGFDASGRLDTIHDRHIEVHEDHIRLVTGRDFNGFETIGRLKNRVLILQRVGQHPPHPFDIIDYQDLRHVYLSISSVSGRGMDTSRRFGRALAQEPAHPLEAGEQHPRHNQDRSNPPRKTKSLPERKIRQESGRDRFQGIE